MWNGLGLLFLAAGAAWIVWEFAHPARDPGPDRDADVYLFPTHVRKFPARPYDWEQDA